MVNSPSPLVFFRLHWPDRLARENLAGTFQQNRTDMSTWMYENRVSKNFASSLNFPCFSLFTVLFAYVVFLVVLWLGICVEVAVDRISQISI